MGAIVKACNAADTVRNTGKQCDTSMVATAMLIAIHRSVKFDDQDLEDPVAWLEGLIHERKAFPLFGQQAPIRTITNNSEADVLVTLDDGTQIFLRYGVYNRIFETTSGGLCYAQALQGLNRSGYSIIEIDQQGQMLARKNNDGTYSGLLIDFMYAPSPVLADFSNTPYKNRFQISYTPIELVNNGIIFSGATQLLSMTGLIDVEVSAAAGSSVSSLNITLKTTCAEQDIASLFETELADDALYVVVNRATGAPVATTGATVSNGVVSLAGTFVAGVEYNVSLVDPVELYNVGVEGYDGSKPGVVSF